MLTQHSESSKKLANSKLEFAKLRFANIRRRIHTDRERLLCINQGAEREIIGEQFRPRKMNEKYRTLGFFFDCHSLFGRERSVGV